MKNETIPWMLLVFLLVLLGRHISLCVMLLYRGAAGTRLSFEQTNQLTWVLILPLAAVLATIVVVWRSPRL